MKKKFISSIFAVIIIPCNYLFAQELNPEGTIFPIIKTDTFDFKFSSYFDQYRLIKDSLDTISKIPKFFDRWLYSNLSRLSIENDSTFNTKDYGEAMKYMVENNLVCNNEDPAQWENIGPRYNFLTGKQGNGWVSSVYINEQNIDEILIGARIAGIFKTTNHGQNWVCVTDNLATPVLGVRQIVASPFNPNRMLAVTGTESGLDPVQTGYLVSNDGGDTWEVGSYSGIDGIFNWFCFDPNVPGRVYAALYGYVLFSNDDGETWQVLQTLANEYVPSTYPQNNSNETYWKFDKVFLSDGFLYLTNSQKEYVGIWRGTLSEITGYIYVQWSQELSEQEALFLYNDDDIVSPNNFGLPYPLGNFPFVSIDKLDYKLYSGGAIGCHYDFLNYTYPYNNQEMPLEAWHAIKTQGWAKETIGGNSDVLTCYYSDNNVIYGKNTEAIGFNNPTDNQIVFGIPNGNQNVLEINYTIPKGARLKICASPYQIGQMNIADHPPHYICNLEDFNYNQLFQNIIYESYVTQGGANGYASTTYTISETVPLVIPYEVYSKCNYQPSLSYTMIYFYFVLEFDLANYDNVGNEKFILHNFDLKPLKTVPQLINVSNVAGSNGSRFFVHVKGADYSTIYRSVNGGLNYELVELVDYSAGANTTFGGARYEKEEIIASLNDPNVFYYATTYLPQRYNVQTGVQSNFTTVSGNSGYHDDFRSSYIVSTQNGEDYIVWGNDGGIGESVNNLTSMFPALNSLNGDICINMIYNMDVHEKTDRILIGLQDNGSNSFYANQVDWDELNYGDGSVAMIRNGFGSSIEEQNVVGDPQYGGSAALKDVPNGPTYPTIVSDNIYIDGGEAFLGMRLEEFRFNDERFVVGLQSGDGIDEGKVIINNLANNHERVVINGSRRIESIAICQRKPNTIYVADGRFKVDDEPKSKIYRTKTGGLTTNDWEALEPSVLVNSPNLSGQIDLNTFKQWSHVSALAVDHVDDNLLYAGLAGIQKINGVVTSELLRVIRSIDAGDSFEDWSQGLPAIPINYLLTVESTNHLIFCATDAGVYYRMDGMTQWECFNNKLPKTRITDLVFNYCSKELYASTYGRGVWRTSVPFFIGTDAEEEITGASFWNTPRDVQSNIVIKNGATLTITADIHIDADRKFVIEPGGRMIVNGATLTNDCGQYWSGIEVWGQASQSQTLQNQGRLILQNNATIEYAREAIQVWKPNDWNSGGGIVQAINSHFLNNRRSVAYYPYHNNTTQGTEIPNSGYFVDCDFKWNDNYIDKFPAPAITMYHVNGVLIRGCDFIDERTTITSTNERASGIHTLDAGYKVIAAYTTLNPPVNHWFNESGTGYDFNNFRNLKNGIIVSNANTPYSVTIDHSKFENVYQSVVLSAVDNTVVTRNLFEYNTSHPTDISNMQGLMIDKSTAYTVEGNTFQSVGLGNFAPGVHARNTGQDDNRIFRNRLDGFYFGNVGQGLNSNTGPFNFLFPSALQGLRWDCNEHTDDAIDMYNAAIPFRAGQGVKIIQGGVGDPTKNTLTDPAFGLVATQIKHTDSEMMQYFWDEFFPSTEEPTLLDGQITAIETFLQGSDKCASNFGSDGINVSEGALISEQVEAIKQSELFTIENLIQQKETELVNNLLAGDAQPLHDLVANITPANKFNVFAQLQDNSPYLSKALIEELAEKDISVRPPAWLRDLVLANIELCRSDSLMEVLQASLNNGMYDQIDQQRFISFTERGELELEIMGLKEQRTDLYNILISNELSRDSLVNWPLIKQLLVDRDHKLCRAEVVEDRINRGEIIECHSILDTIDANLSDYVIPDIKQEMEDYTLYKRYILTMSNNTGIIEDLDSAEVQQLIYARDSFIGAASVQASNILCFLEGICEDYQFVDNTSLRMMEEQNATENMVTDALMLVVIPNPNSGEFQLEVPDECVIRSIDVYDVSGRKVGFDTNQQRGNTSIIKIYEPKTGILLIRVTCEDGTDYLERVLIK